MSGNDEFTILSKNVRKMQSNLRSTVQKIGSASAQLATASEELSSITSESARGLEQQNYEVEQAATAVNEMTAAVEEVARNASLASSSAQRTDHAALAGHNRVLETIQLVNTLSVNMDLTAETIIDLTDQTKKISSVLDVIRSIAEQTNLLALNAAIEAARAGEQGRGFAVVADEVRALAHRTQKSTSEIEQMIIGIQSGTENSVRAIRESQASAIKTLEAAEVSGTALQAITAAAAEITERNLVIATASEEQAHVSREIDRNLTRIHDLSAQSASGALQTSSASSELASLASDLESEVAKFRV